jgi:hypothetical protein
MSQALVTGTFLPETYAFTIWIDLRHPEVLQDGPLKQFFTSDPARSIEADDEGAFLMTIDWLRRQHGEQIRLPTETGKRDAS